MSAFEIKTIEYRQLWIKEKEKLYIGATMTRKKIFNIDISFSRDKQWNKGMEFREKKQRNIETEFSKKMKYHFSKKQKNISIGFRIAITWISSTIKEKEKIEYRQ